MSATIHTTPPTLAPVTSRVVAAVTRRRFRLTQSADAWAVLSPDGELVVRAAGPSARLRCLQAARARGILALR